MSRLPQPSSSRTPSKSSSASSIPTPTSSPAVRARTTSTLRSPATSARLTPAPTATRTPSPSKPAPGSRLTPSPSKATYTTTTPIRARTKSTPRPPGAGTPTTRPASKPKLPPPAQDVADESSPATRLSIKEAIALKRAEAKKAQEAAARARRDDGPWAGLEDASPHAYGKPAVEEEDEGRPSIRDTIERARTSGVINLSSRTLRCLPGALFSIHLGVEPSPIEGVEDPELPEGRGGKKEVPWFEQKDLEALRAWNNEIVGIQPEISLFGSLKIIDLHSNKLSSLPGTFGDLSTLASLDLSHNTLTTLPPTLFALPALVHLNVSHNNLSSLPFNAPFATPSSLPKKTEYFAPEVVRADSVLPCLTTLTATHNAITATSIDLDALPPKLETIDLSENSLGDVAPLFTATARLAFLRTLRIARTTIPEKSFQPTLLDDIADPFPSLTLFDFEESFPSKYAEIVRTSLKRIQRREVVVGMPGQVKEKEGTVAVVVGKRDGREAWEVDADRRAQLKKMRSRGAIRDDAQADAVQPPLPPQGSANGNPAKTANGTTAHTIVPKPAPKPVVKEQWEIEAEQGLLTEGGRRRARAQAAAAASASSSSPPPSTSPSSALANKYYHAPTQTLTLPPLLPPSRAHGRAFSLQTPSQDIQSTDVWLPSATLPYAFVGTQAFAKDLRVLEIRNRRADVSFLLASGSSAADDEMLMPRVETLVLEACGLGDTVPIVRGDVRESESTLKAIVRLFPGLRDLDLSYNSIEEIREDAWHLLVGAGAEGGFRGLKALRLRGNRIEDIDGLGAIAKALFPVSTSNNGNGTSSGEGGDRWTLDELDVRENAVRALPPEVGALPLEALLVEGNVFRVPPRRVWEREGTKGLLAWLRARVGVA